MNKATRRKLHEAINSLSHAEVAEIVKREHPELTGKSLDEIGRLAVAEAHAMVSPKDS